MSEVQSQQANQQKKTQRRQTKDNNVQRKQQNQKQQRNQQQNQQQRNQAQQKQQAQNNQSQQNGDAPEKQISEISVLFPHIPVIHRWTTEELLSRMKPADRDLVHPALLEFALQTAQDVSIDEDERTKIFLKMMMAQIRDEPVDDRGQIIQNLFSLIKRTMNLISIIRLTPTTIGIGNAVRYIKNQIITENPPPPEVQRSDLLDAIQSFIDDKINEVSNFLSKTTADTIVDDDVILTYGWSPLICKAFRIAASQGKKFRVIVVDSRPNFQSRRLVEEISDLDVKYVLISGLSYVMPEVKKVLIEPCGILSNNAAQTPAGTAMISMVASDCNVPVFFVCGSYRFVSDVRIDALAKNEIIGKEFIEKVPSDETKTDQEYLALNYDITPGEYVDLVICELGNIPLNSISTNIKYIQESYTMFSRTKAKTKSQTK
ncbi:translation initiation factor eIF-2B subunit delta [Histomonas meleagridis]|uniref:translation initiation factor eIF-2B subunit delta n=1 Tax=Histomonas meleagridis TaxID=135588 RepID=UPI0035598A8C|nr:translation initiation factor eIF-2B subunit delta [Histomonas meleagridis]KAH0797245.1 translation initiation factor eIF-2B subunit delta [Histomonas meleagridis]